MSGSGAPLVEGKERGRRRGGWSVSGLLSRGR